MNGDKKNKRMTDLQLSSKWKKNFLMNVDEVNFYIDDENFNHFKSLSKVQQKAVNNICFKDC